MSAQDILQYASENASDDAKRLFRLLWINFGNTVRAGRPAMFLPKDCGDRLGELALEAMAARIAILISGTAFVQYNPAVNAYIIAPINNIPGGPDIYRILYSIHYLNAPQVISRLALAAQSSIASNMAATSPDVAATSPDVAATSPDVVATSPDVAATSTNAESNTATAETEKTPKTPNSFILFRSDAYSQHCAEHPDSPKMQAKDFSSIAADLWKVATPEVKEHYAQLARERKEQQNAESGPQQENSTRRSVKNKRKSRVSTGQSSEESSGQSSGQSSGDNSSSI